MPQRHAGSEELSHRGRGVRRPQLEKTTGFVRLEQSRQPASASRSFREPAQRMKIAYQEDDDKSSGSNSGASGSGSGGDSDSDAESSEGHAEQAELDRLREGVKDVPFEMVQKLSALGSSRAAEHGENSSRRERGPAHVKRANKNAPQEVSSKIRVGIIPAHLRAAARERKGRDPRFDRLSGKLSEDLFEKSYAWLKDVAQRDAKELRDVASKEKDADARGELLLRASQIEQKLKQDAKKGEETQLKRARKKAMAEVVSSTGQAFWLKKRELRQIEIARKYETLKAKGQGAVDDYGNARPNGTFMSMHCAIHTPAA
jgi:ribosomal RNA-processing protein 36